MNDNHTELPRRKRFRDENPAALSSPEQNSNKKKRGQGALIPQDPLPSTHPNDPVTLAKEQDAEPNGVIAEHSVSHSAPRKRKRGKRKHVALASSEGEQLNSLQVESGQRNDKEEGAEPCEVEVRAVQPQVCPKHDLANPVVQEKGNFVELMETSAEQPHLWNNQEQAVKPRKENMVGRNEGAADSPELGPVPGSTPSKDTPMKKKPEKKKMKMLSGEGEEPKESNDAEHPQVCPKPESASPIHTQHVIPMGPEVPTDPEQKLSKKKRRKKKKKISVLNNEMAEPDKNSIPPIAASQTDQKPSTDSATPVDQEQKLSKKKRRKKKKNSVLNNEVEEPDKNSIHPIAASQTDQKPSTDSATPIDQEQKTSKKKRRKKKKNSMLNNEVAEPDKNSIHPIAATQTDQKPSTDSATPIDQEQKKSKKKRRKRKKSALKSEGSESNENNTESTAEIPVSEDNVEQPANSPILRSKQLKGNKNPCHKKCMACHKPDHKVKDCPSIDAICFFCGKVGHTLANCSESQAGRFAWCLFCSFHGHFTSKCPRKGHGIDPKVVAANEPVHKPVEA